MVTLHLSQQKVHRQVPMFIAPNVLVQVLLNYKLHTKKYTKKIVGVVQHSEVRQRENFLVTRRADYSVHI
jgi:hypothetical protein